MPRSADSLLQPPQQKRAAATLDRIVAAALDLLATRDLGQIAMEEIASAAGVAVGTLYTKFKNKDALLAHLLTAVQARQAASMAEALAPGRWAGRGLAERLAWLADQLYAGARMHPGLIRAILAAVMQQQLPGGADAAGANLKIVASLTRWLLDCRAEITAPDPELAARVAVTMISRGVYMIALSPAGLGHDEPDRERAELLRLVTAGLTAPSPPA